MSWHWKPSIGRWDKFWAEEKIIIYSLLSGENSNIENEKDVIRKLLRELKPQMLGLREKLPDI